MSPRMHPDQVVMSPALVRRLVDEQFPPWAGCELRRVDHFGTDHDVHRLGDDLVVRLPTVGWAAGQAGREARWLPVLAPHLPIAVPRHVATGAPAHGYPFGWSVWTWLPGEAVSGRLGSGAADVLAGVVRALRSIPTDGAPPRSPGSRGGPHTERDDAVRRAIVELGDRIHGAAARRAWGAALEAPGWDGDVWLHGDLLPGNLLVHDGTPTGVIDFGGLDVGDPACDLQPAWHLFDDADRIRFLDALDTDDAAEQRARGWVLSQAVMALPYYWDTNPGIVAQSLRALDAVLR